MHDQDTAAGLCECGCGQRTPLATHTNRRRGYVKGQPLRRILGHQNRTRFTRPICAAPQVSGRAKGEPATGTHAGYMRHRKASEPPCDACRLGHNRWKQKLYRTNEDYRRWQGAWSRNRRLTEYGITQRDYDRMLAEQGGGCAICGATESGKGSRLHVDHDHSCCPDAIRSCGRCVRGLLCMKCNQGLGQFGDDANLLLTAVVYLTGRSRGDQGVRRDHGPPSEGPFLARSSGTA